MSNGVVETLFLLAFFAPPLAVVAGALMLLVARWPSWHHRVAHAQPAAMHT
jgi:hypothetical protein